MSTIRNELTLRNAARVAALSLLVLSCDVTKPTAPNGPPEAAQPIPGGAPLDSLTPSPVRWGTKLLPRDRNLLLSTPEELADGVYRYKLEPGDTLIANLKREDVFVNYEGEPTVRRVASAQRVGDEIVLVTGAARWDEVFVTGTYAFSRTFATPPIRMKNVSVCDWALQAVRRVDPSATEALCGKDMEKEKSIGPVEISIEGRIDSLMIRNLAFDLDAQMEFGITIDGGGISGGQPPTFSPCNRGNYLGCITTPTGAALIDWLRSFAPLIPDGALPPVRLCVPGTPVRIAAGYWDYSGIIPIWRLPVFEQCRIANFGVLPTIVLPSLKSARVRLFPDVEGDVTLAATVSGKVSLKFPVPVLGYKAGIDFIPQVKGNLELGPMIDIGLAAIQTDFTVGYGFAFAQDVILGYTEDAGWTVLRNQTIEQRAGPHTMSITRPDSLILSFGMPVTAEVKACFPAATCSISDDTTSSSLALGLGLEVGAGPYFDIINTRDPVSADSGATEATKLAFDYYVHANYGAEVKFPVIGWFIKKKFPKLKDEKDFGRVPMADAYFPGMIVAAVDEIGPGSDPDGYIAEVARADTLPWVFREPSVRRLGAARDHGDTLLKPVAGNGSALFFSVLPCQIVYSDAIAAFSPAAWVGLTIAQSVGVDVPSYGFVLGCNLLPARYRVTLRDVAENCTVTQPNVELWLRGFGFPMDENAPDTARFQVTCTDGATGAMTIVTDAATLTDEDPPYTVAVDGVARRTMGAQDTVTVTGLSPGVRAVTLTGGSTNCTFVSTDPASVSVVEDDTVLVHAVHSCTEPVESATSGMFTVRAATSGGGTDPNGYQLVVNGTARGRFAVGGQRAVKDVAPSEPNAVFIADIARNCRTTSANPFVVTLDSLGTNQQLTRNITCSALEATTLVGVLERGPNGGSPRVRTDAGHVVQLTGAWSQELKAIEGNRVEVWGVAAGPMLNVHDYRVISTLDRPQWLGLVIVRGDETWLYGETAVQLEQAPEALRALSGAYVWITGTTIEDRVRPTSFRTVRAAQ